MRISGTNTVTAPVEQVWSALLDPGTLVHTIPGCERLEETGEHAYAMTVSAGVAAIKGTYDGTCRLFDLTEHESLTLRVDGAGAPGTIGASVRVGLADNGDGSTTLSYDADAAVGGMVGGVGQRMLTSVSRRMAAEFFSNLEQHITGSGPPASPAPASDVDSPGERRTVFTASARQAQGQDAFLKGVAVGAGLVLLGVLAGSRLGGRR